VSPPLSRHLAVLFSPTAVYCSRLADRTDRPASDRPVCRASPARPAAGSPSLFTLPPPHREKDASAPLRSSCTRPRQTRPRHPVLFFLVVLTKGPCQNVLAWQ
jgi:hypothetical protein